MNDPTQLAKEKTEDEFDQTYLAIGFTWILSSVLKHHTILLNSQNVMGHRLNVMLCNKQ